MSSLFLRHGKLASPYHDYNNLTLEQLDELALEKVQPEIDQTFAQTMIDQHLTSGLVTPHIPTIIFHSPSLRTNQTAILLAKALDPSLVELQELPELHEILFSPLQLVTSEQFSTQGMDAVRTAVFEAIASDSLPEKQITMVQRVRHLQSLPDKYPDTQLIFITHGFFMRLLQLALLRHTTEFSISNQQAVTNYGYLEGFAIP